MSCVGEEASVVCRWPRNHRAGDGINSIPVSFFTGICDRHIDLVVFSTLGNEGNLDMKGIQIRLQGGVSVPVLNIGV